jgi:hypothetical protein
MTDWRFAPTAIKCFCSEFPQLGSHSRPQIDGAANSLPSERHLENADEIEVFSFTEGLTLVLFDTLTPIPVLAHIGQMQGSTTFAQTGRKPDPNSR